MTMKNITNRFFCGNLRYQLGTENTRRHYSIMLYMNIFIGVSVTILNMLVLMSIFSQKRKNSPSSILLIVLTAINLSQGLLIQPLSSVSSYLMSIDQLLCRLVLADNYFSLIIGMMDILTIFMVNIQFYLAIVKPFFYKTKCNQTGYWIALCFSWIVFGIATVLSYLYQQFRGIFIVFVGISTISIYAIMCGIFLFVSKEVNRMLKKASTSKDSIILKASVKRTRTLASSGLIAFTFSVLPIAISSLFLDVTSPAGFWLALLLKFNAILDPIIYCIRMSSIRKPIYGWFKYIFM